MERLLYKGRLKRLVEGCQTGFALGWIRTIGRLSRSNLGHRLVLVVSVAVLVLAVFWHAPSWSYSHCALLRQWKQQYTGYMVVVAAATMALTWSRQHVVPVGCLLRRLTCLPVWLGWSRLRATRAVLGFTCPCAPISMAQGTWILSRAAPLLAMPPQLCGPQVVPQTR